MSHKETVALHRHNLHRRMAQSTTGERVGLAELIGALSLGIDLGFNQPMEHVLRQCWIALRLADHLGLDEEHRSTVYYTALLTNVGCHTDAHEQAKWFGDDIALKNDKYVHGLHGVRSALAGMKKLGAGHPVLHRFRIGLSFALAGHRELEGMVESHAAMARSLATELGLPSAVQHSVGAAYEQWDGKGWPGELKGEDVPIEARISLLCEFVEVAHRSGGVDAAVALARRFQGARFDPHIADTFASTAPDVLAGLDDASTWSRVVAAEPVLSRPLVGDELDDALRAIADFVDLKTPFMLGHARGVTQLVDAAAPEVGLDEVEQVTLRRAALVHGLGRLGISNAIWDKPGALGLGEWERVRLQPYLTERMLQQSPVLSVVGALAGQVRERLDGSGYPHGLARTALSMPARLLGAADAYQAMREPRPHRPALSAGDAADELRAQGRSGLFDAAAVEAVLTAAGHRARVRRDRPAGLTEREVDVLRLVARGLSSKQIAEELVISPKTARNHIEHIYEKTGATSRVTASLFAIKHGLVAELVA